MKTVYVAGAMSADNILTMLDNIHDGIKLGAELLKRGYAPFVPHMDVAYKLQNGHNFDVPLQYYYDYTMEFLKRCDVVVVCKNWVNSKGTLAEIDMAQRLGIPVYYSLTDFLFDEVKSNNVKSKYIPEDIEVSGQDENHCNCYQFSNGKIIPSDTIFKWVDNAVSIKEI